MKNRKPVLYVLLSVFCLAAIVLPAAPAQASGAYITLTPSSGPPGQVVQVAGYGFVADEEDIHVLFDGQQVGGGCQADAYGDWALSFQVPLKPPAVYNVTAQGQNTTVIDTFEIKARLIISSTAGGSVTTPGEGAFTYDEGTWVNLVASSGVGYYFVNWTGDVTTIANVNAATTTITMNGHYSITANFEEIPVTYYTLTMAVNGSGSTSPSVGQHTYVADTVVSISATPTSGYRFVRWTGDVGTIANVNASNTTITMNGHYSITGNFEHTLALECLVSPNPTEVRKETYFMASASGGVPPYSWSWTVEGTEVATVGNATHIFAALGNYIVCVTVTDSLDNEALCCSVVAVNPAPSGVYSVTISSTAGGSVITPGEGTFNYTSGTAVGLAAIPDAGYYFVNWDGDVDTIANVNASNTTITMQGDYEITARFLAGVVDTKTETVTGGGTVDATEEADTVVAVNGTATVTVAEYAENPGSDAPTGFSSLDKYIDVYVPDTTEVTELEIRLYYTAAELAAANISEESLRLFWWDGDDWVACSDSGVNTASTNGYSGYMWAKIRNDTTPSLADLQGTEFGGYGHPSSTPERLCFIATAAYGTDTAKEIDILREFRDAVLLPNSLGARFVSFYYKTSPPIANFISQHEVLRTAVRVGFVDPIVKILNWSYDLWSARAP